MDDFIIEDGHNRLHLASDEHGAVAFIQQDGEFWLTNSDLRKMAEWINKRQSAASSTQGKEPK